MKLHQRTIGLFILGLALAALWPATASARRAWERDENRKMERPEDSAIRSSVAIPRGQAMHARLATVKIEDAVAAAREAASGVVVEAELENENGSLVWGVEIVGETQVVEVIVDAGNRKVLAVEIEDGHAKKNWKKGCEKGERGEKWRGKKSWCNDDEKDDDEDDEDEDEDDRRRGGWR